MTQKSNRASVHRFHDTVALYIPEAEQTIYLSDFLALKIASALAECAGEIQDTAFTNSEFGTRRISEPGINVNSED